MEWLILIAAIAVGVPAAAWLVQERLIFFPQTVSSTTHLPAHASALEIVAADGTHLRGWIVKGASTPAPAVIYFGGNAEEVSWTLSDARWPRDWTIIGVNYRGYGASEGVPGEAALTSDALAIYDAAAKRPDIDPSRIVVFGRSLGTAIAAYVAAKRPAAGAVLVSPYDSLTAVGSKHYPWLPVSLLLRHRFEAAANAKHSSNAAARDHRRERFDRSARAIARALRGVGRTQDVAGRSARGTQRPGRLAGVLGRHRAFPG